MENKIKIAQSDSSDQLCAKIQQDAEREVNKIIDRAQEKSAEIIGKANSQAQMTRTDILKTGQDEAISIERKILSTVNLEIRKILLGARETVFDLVIGEMKKKAAALRSSGEYPEFLKNLVIEGAIVVDKKELEISAGAADENIFKQPFIDGIKKELKEKYSKEVVLELKKSGIIKDIGVVIKSKDQRIEYDNTFGARLARNYDELRVEILREVFGEDV